MTTRFGKAAGWMDPALASLMARTLDETDFPGLCVWWEAIYVVVHSLPEI
jgi:hypothetical protein